MSRVSSRHYSTRKDSDFLPVGICSSLNRCEVAAARRLRARSSLSSNRDHGHGRRSPKESKDDQDLDEGESPRPGRWRPNRCFRRDGHGLFTVQELTVTAPVWLIFTFAVAVMTLPPY